MKLLARIAGRLHDLLRGESAATYFDIADPRILNPFIQSLGVEPLSVDAREAESNLVGAMRFVLAILLFRPEWRKRFPKALSSGSDGAFARALTQEGKSAFGLSDRAIQNLHELFRSYPGDRTRRITEQREDFRDVFPFFRTPHPDRAEFLSWFHLHAQEAFPRSENLRLEECLWFLMECDESADRGLIATYLLHPEWQKAVPDGITKAGWPRLIAYLRTRYQLSGRWVRKASPADSSLAPWEEEKLDQNAQGICAPSPKPGINILAHFRYESGLQEAAFGVVKALRRSGIAHSLRDLPVVLPRDASDREQYQGLEIYDDTLYIAAVNTFPHLWYPRTGLWQRPGVRRIALWYWELEELPKEWHDQIQWPDEIWAPTSFIAEAFRKTAKVPVIPMLPGVEIPPFEPRPRSVFELEEGLFTFLFTFDMGSVMERKNPLGLLEAFRRAFRADDKVQLLVKCSRGESDPQSLAQLQESIARTPRARLMNRLLSRSDTLALLNAADCYVSLHRSEGLGLGLAESMLLGKPVIATAYSGNIDFMTSETARLVRYTMTPIVNDHPPYPKGCLWAEPDLDHAAHLLRTTVENPEETAELAARGRTHALTILAPDAYAQRLTDRLSALRAMRE